MKLKDEAGWEECQKNNTDPYGKCCIDVARRVMEILDEGKDFDCHKLVCQADKDIKAGGITGFMAGCVADIVSNCHERGDEFRIKWNRQYRNDVNESDDEGGVVNPAILTIGGHNND